MLGRVTLLFAACYLCACGQSPTESLTTSSDNDSVIDNSGGDSVGETPPAERCADYREGFKNSYFGDLHTHTSYSLDAYFFNALNDPQQAHRYAKGLEAMPLPAKGSDDIFTAGQEIFIDRPLDFNAVTDHAEFLGGFHYSCDNTSETQQECDERVGRPIRQDIRNIITGNSSFRTQFLQGTLADSPTTLVAWHDTLTMNEAEYEPCTYSTLHGYEYTSNELSQMFHRNVIFRGNDLEVPLDVYGASDSSTAVTPQNGNDDWQLFDYLNADCVTRADCDVLTIPHNSNRGDGRMFLAADETANRTVLGDLNGAPLGRKLNNTDTYIPMRTEDAEQRRSLDRSIEIFQHKGQSECAIGLEGDFLANDEGYDPGCDFEVDNSVCRGEDDDPASCALFCTGNPLTDPNFCGYRDYGTNVVPVCAFGGPDGSSRPAEGGFSTSNCRSPYDFYRNAMAEGMKIKLALGINPYRANIVAGTDTHSGTSGYTSESSWLGHAGVLDDEPKEQLGFWDCDPSLFDQDPSAPNNCRERTFVDFARPLNPGGLTGIWAEENLRENVWDAIHSGETWGTSGNRIRVRSVASWEPLPDNICDRLASGEDLTGEGGLNQAAPMGGTLPENTSGQGPHIAVWAEQDPDAAPLQQIDIIKGFLNEDNEPKVLPLNSIVRTEASVIPPRFSDCAVAIDNHPESLCAVWQDTDFDATRDAYYYPRVREIETCRWSAYACRQAQTDCTLLDPSNGIFPEDSGLQGYEGCCEISDDNGVFSGEDRFDTIEE
ncbi:MAG: DUF3604 domain-containing protein, partial [Gammaproteobacteria bacterium]|nr:DUF3604 domain-containing protein [Gammaproteobacteria bacterium]